MPDGAVLCEFREIVSDTSAVTTSRQRFESAFENKQSTMPDAVPEEISNIFRGVRPKFVA